MNPCRSALFQPELPLGETAHMKTTSHLGTDWVVSAAVGLGAAGFGGPLSDAEAELADSAAFFPDLDVGSLAEDLLSGHDPLGNAISRSLTASARRAAGIVYTPRPVVDSMVDWTLDRDPNLVVDGGCGSGRFSVEFARRHPEVEILAVDSDPVATLACRAALAVVGARKAQVVNGDFTRLAVPHGGRAAFVGNPPYVRHHQVSRDQKLRAKELAARLGLEGWSSLSGLHMHFFLAALAQARQGDVGCLVTSAEWLDVAYGASIRNALANGAGAVGIHMVDPKARAFEDAMTTAVITCFEVGSEEPKVRIRTVKSVEALRNLNSGGRFIPRAEMARANRWSQVLASGPRPRAGQAGFVRLGAYVRVSRGAVTGANAFFILTLAEATRLGLTPYVKPVVSDAGEVLRAAGAVGRAHSTKVLLDPDPSIDLSAPEHASLRRYLNFGEDAGFNRGYICCHRRPWWRVGAKQPPAMATYMARQAPAFALNPAGLSIVNVVHGLYPLPGVSDVQLRGIVSYLNANRDRLVGFGRTYQGGLEKFEPREMEELMVPGPDALQRWADA